MMTMDQAIEIEVAGGQALTNDQSARALRFAAIFEKACQEMMLQEDTPKCHE